MKSLRTGVIINIRAQSMLYLYLFIPHFYLLLFIYVIILFVEVRMISWNMLKICIR